MSARRRWPWILAAVVLAVPIGLVAAIWLFVDAEALRPRLVAAVEGATGRQLTIGRMNLALSFAPTIELHDVKLANAPGGSRPEMLAVRRASVQARLLPLLSNRIEVTRVELEAPDLLLETDAEGRGNWAFQRIAAPVAPPPPGAPAPVEAARRVFEIGVQALRIAEGRVTWRDGRTNATDVIAIPTLEASAPIAGPTTLSGNVVARGQTLAIAATTGAIASLGTAPAWPVRVTLGLAGAEATAEGSVAPDQTWTATLAARVPELARLSELAPGLPPLRDLTLAGRATGQGAAIAGVSDLALRVGASDLGALRPGLLLRAAEVTAASADAPIAVTAEATLGAAPLRAAGTLGPTAVLLGQRDAPMPIDLRLETTGAAATLKGAVARWRAMTGIDVALEAQAADLAALSPLAGTPLPALREVRAQARITERGPGFQAGVNLGSLILTAAQGEAWGDLAILRADRIAVHGRLASRRIDLDAILAALPGPAPAAPAPAAAAAPAPAAAAGPARIIPAAPLRLDGLRAIDADLRISIQELTLRAQPWRRIEAHVVLAGGQALVSPLTVQTPAGPLTLEISADGRQVPGLRVAARSPGLDLAALQEAAGQPRRITGRVELDADLRGAGADLRALAASLDGRLGLAMVGGVLEPALTGPAIAALRARVPVLPALPQRLPLECVALRVDFTDGIGRVGTLLLDAPAAKVAGSGTVDLRQETVALRMLHDLRAAGQSVRVAADLGGSLANAGYRGVQVQNLGELLGGLAGRVGGDAGALLGALAPRAGRVEALPDCGPALTAARNGRAGEVPAARAPDPAPDTPERQPALPGPAGDLLRGLLGR